MSPQTTPTTTPSKSPSATGSGKKTPGQAFTRVDPTIWSEQILTGLEDNSCETLALPFPPSSVPHHTLQM
jgi:hypothetical protein